MPIKGDDLDNNQDDPWVAPGSDITNPSTTNPSTGPSAAERLAERRAMERLRASYLEVLRRWGIKETKNLLNLVERAVRGQWSSSQFLGYVRQTPEYRQQFRGIRWRQGMSEAQYNAMYAQYAARALDIGEKLSRKQFAKMLKGGVEFDEYSDRVDALVAIEEYAPLWAQFQQTLELRGVRVPGKELEKKELQKFIMGLGSAKWEQIWEEVAVTTNLEKVAGVEVTAPRAGERATPDSYGVMRTDMLRLIKQLEALTPGFEVEKLTSQDWAAIGKRLRQYDISYLQRYDLTTKDILEMELGGPNAAKIAERAERLLKTQEAFDEPRAIPQASMQVGQRTAQQEELPQSL